MPNAELNLRASEINEDLEPQMTPLENSHLPNQPSNFNVNPKEAKCPFLPPTYVDHTSKREIEVKKFVKYLQTVKDELDIMNKIERFREWYDENELVKQKEAALQRKAEIRRYVQGLLDERDTKDLRKKIGEFRKWYDAKQAALEKEMESEGGVGVGKAM
jgi:hypothetical protein